jgi:hypothetical protein
MRETGDKGKKGEKTTPCPPPHRFRDSFCLFGICIENVCTNNVFVCAVV